MEDYPWAEKIVNRYLEEGYEVKQMIPIFDPAIQREGVYTFYRSGFTLYLEKEGDTSTLDFSEKEQVEEFETFDDLDDIFQDFDDFELDKDDKCVDDYE